MAEGNWRERSPNRQRKKIRIRRRRRCLRIQGSIIERVLYSCIWKEEGWVLRRLRHFLFLRRSWFIIGLFCSFLIGFLHYNHFCLSIIREVINRTENGLGRKGFVIWDAYWIIVQRPSNDTGVLSLRNRRRVINGEGRWIDKVFFAGKHVMGSATTPPTVVLQGAITVLMAPPIKIEAATGLTKIAHLGSERVKRDSWGNMVRENHKKSPISCLYSILVDIAN